MTSNIVKFGLAVLALLATLALNGCSTIDAGGNMKKDAAALHGDYSGKDLSGSFAIVRLPSDIPGVPESKGQQARWSQTEVDQVLYLDADCQKQLFEQLPGWAQAIVKEGGWAALATAVGEGLFATAFPGAIIHQYVMGGLGIGALGGANTGRYRQDSSEKGSIGYCVSLNVYEARNRYHILEGVNVVPWYGDGHAALPKASEDSTAPMLPHVSGSVPPMLGR